MKVSELFVGLKFKDSVRLSKEKVAQFATLTGDHNQIHLDDAAARAIDLERAVVHGFFVAALAPPMIVDHLPGIVLREVESLKFKQPVFVGDTVTIEATLEEMPSKMVGNKEVYILNFAVNYLTRDNVLAIKATIRALFAVEYSASMRAVA